ncbi:MAG: 50S ribosomal protein L9 [Dehalococcoidia bacterium]
MKVVFLEDVPGTARIGEIKDVKPGFARNFLLPRKLAMTASPAVVKSAEARAARETRLQQGRDHDAQAVADRLEGAAYTIAAKAGSTGKLFGSVSAADVAVKVGETLGVEEFDRHDVLLRDHIKELGDYAISVKLSKNVSATVNVSVVGEDGTTAADIKARSEGGSKAAAAVPAPAVETADKDEASDESADDDADDDDADEDDASAEDDAEA